MTATERRTVRTIATLGMAVCGPTTLLTGLLTFVTIPSGINKAVAAIFVVAAGSTVVCALLLLNDHVRHSD